MGTWTLTRGGGFEGVPLGAGREDVLKKLGEPDAIFRRVPTGPPVHDFQEQGAQVTFDDKDRVKFVETYPPADPTIEGIQLLGRPEDDVLRELRDAGIEMEQYDSGVRLPEWRAALFVDGSTVQAVSAGDG